MNTKVSVIIPTFNAEKYLPNLFEVLSRLRQRGCEIIVIDSSSDDNTELLARQSADRFVSVDRAAFRHGGTRTEAAQVADGEILVFLTQDALPVNEESIERLIAVFEDEKVGAAYGRQLPYPHENPFGEHLRLFNYGTVSYRRSYGDKQKHGIKTAFLSDSFAAYRRSALEEIGWFKKELNFGEDMHAGGRLLASGFTLAYVADAQVFHSHSYTLRQEFSRYFETGRFHRQESWLLETFGSPEGEGLRFVKSEWVFLMKKRLFHLLPLSLARNVVKLLGYKAGRLFSR